MNPLERSKVKSNLLEKTIKQLTALRDQSGNEITSFIQDGTSDTFEISTNTGKKLLLSINDRIPEDYKDGVETEHSEDRRIDTRFEEFRVENNADQFIIVFVWATEGNIKSRCDTVKYVFLSEEARETFNVEEYL